MKHFETITRKELSRRLGDSVLANTLAEHFLGQMEPYSIPRTEGQIKVENSELDIDDNSELYRDGFGSIYLYDLDDDDKAILTNIETLEEIKESEMGEEDFNKFWYGLDDYDPDEEAEGQEVIQWYLIDWDAADYLKDHTDEMVTYVDEVDCYFWAITDGSSWDDIPVTLTFDY